MISSADLRAIVSRISVGNLCPTMKISAVDRIAVQNWNDNSPPHPVPAINVVMTVKDALDQNTSIDLHQCYPVPEDVTTEKQVVDWVYGRVKAVLVHELDEFFMFDGIAVKAPGHPLPEHD